VSTSTTILVPIWITRRWPPVVPIQRQGIADSAISASNSRARAASTVTTTRDGPSPKSVRSARESAGSDATQGWMRLMAAAPNLERNSALQAAYVEKQAQLWAAMLAGGKSSRLYRRLVVDDQNRLAVADRQGLLGAPLLRRGWKLGMVGLLALAVFTAATGVWDPPPAGRVA